MVVSSCRSTTIATVHDVDANFTVHRARRSPRQHDRKL